MAHGDAREGKWRGNWRIEWVASTLHTTSEHGVSSITTADAHTSAASSRLNWRPSRFERTRLFRRKTNSGFCACAIIFKMASTTGCDMNRQRRIMMTVTLRPVGGTLHVAVSRGLINQRKLLWGEKMLYVGSWNSKTRTEPAIDKQQGRTDSHTPNALRPMNTKHAVPMPFPCHAMPRPCPAPTVPCPSWKTAW